MADDALTRKEAEMDTDARVVLRIEEIVALMEYSDDGGGWHDLYRFREAASDWFRANHVALSRQTLSLESVREEALEEIAQLCLDIGEQEMIRTGRVAAARTYQIGCENCADAIRALRHPSGRVLEGPAHGLPCWPVDAPESPAKEQPMDQENEDRETMRRDFERGVYEREGKEQPGEEIAAPQRVTGDTAGQPGAYLAEVAAPDLPLPPERP